MSGARSLDFDSHHTSFSTLVPDTPTTQIALGRAAVRSNSNSAAALAGPLRSVRGAVVAARRGQSEARAQLGELMRATWSSMHRELAVGLTHLIRCKVAPNMNGHVLSPNKTPTRLMQ
jgi:hypothetical protein